MAAAVFERRLLRSHFQYLVHESRHGLFAHHLVLDKNSCFQHLSKCAFRRRVNIFLLQVKIGPRTFNLNHEVMENTGPCQYFNESNA